MRQYSTETIVVITTQILISLLDIVLTLTPRKKPKSNPSTKIGIEAGTRGWDSIYFQELFASAIDYFEPQNVKRIEVSRLANRVAALKRILPDEEITHLIYDPRTNYSNLYKAVFEAIQINIFCYRHRIRVLVSLTDPSLTIWRIQSALASRRSGIIFTPMDVSKMGWLCSRMKISGPHFMPISMKTLRSMEQRILSSDITGECFENLEFRGTLYPTRKVFFEDLNKELEICGSLINVETKMKSEAEVTSELYWSDLVDARICVTTTFQYVFGNFHVDRPGINQMVFRISEALAAGNLLFISDFPGVEKYFVAGEDLVIFSSPEDLASKLIYFSQNITEANQIRTSGFNKMQSLQTTGFFWQEILGISGNRSKK